MAYEQDNIDAFEINEENNYMVKDPYEDITSSLLNAFHIKKYVEATNMIYPFYPERLKEATYPVSIGNNCYYWEDDDFCKVELGLAEEGKETSFILKKNSIAFVELEPQFSIPEYMVLRFNLKVKHVYKGLLLGTGPIVDPGFKGKLHIPLHNLTSNDYEFKYKEELIQVEFTKLSRHNHDNQNDSVIKFKNFEDKSFKEQIFDDLKDNVLGTNYSVANSLPSELEKFKKNARRYEEKAEKISGTTELIKNAAILTVIGIVVASVTLVTQIFDLVNSSNERIDSLNDNIIQMEKQIDFITEENINKDEKINYLLIENDGLSKEVKYLNKEIYQLQQNSGQTIEN